MTDFIAPAEDRQRAEQRRATQTAAPAQQRADEAFVAPEGDRQRATQRRSTRGQQQRPDTATDMARSAVTGVRRGVAGIVGLPGEVQRLSRSAGQWLGGAALRAAGKSDEEIAAAQQSLTPATLPDTGDVNAFMDEHSQVFGREYQPQTTAGEYARTVGEFAPNALLPGGAGVRVLRTVVPALVSETAGQATEGTPYEPAARLAGALTGGIATEAGIAAGSQSTAMIRSIANELADVGMEPGQIRVVTDMVRRRAPAGQIRAQIVSDLGAEPPVQRTPTLAREMGLDPEGEAAALERQFAPMTAGERSADPRAMQVEDDLRRGLGSLRAQRTMQAFDDRRAPVLRERAMGIVTRGQPALSDDVGEAGTVLSDTLRGQVDDMRAMQGTLYDDALRLAGSEPVAPTDELIANVDRVMGDEFLDAPQARQVITRLHQQMSGGQATYATVERARQALNRLLGTAMKGRNDADAYAVARVIDELDAFVAPRLSPEASRAVTEARGFTREMLNSFGRRQRTDLATGHVGRSDPGGAAIDRIVNTDMTGEQVIGAVLGETKPSQQTLGAVRRIHERATRAIQYTNRGAQSGVRVPGRTVLGNGELDRRVAGTQRFLADDPAGPYGMQQPKAELQAIREGLMHRILRPLDTRQSGQMIPAQTMATNLRKALHGSGREIAQIIYTPRERQALDALLRFMERSVPPPGTAVSGTAPALARAMSEAINATMKVVFGPANALFGGAPGRIAGMAGDALADSATTGVARRAVATPRSTARRPVQRRPDPPNHAPVRQAIVATDSALNERESRPGDIRQPRELRP